MSKTILVVTNVYPPNFIGGAELVAHHHARIMREAGHRVIVFAGEARPGTTRYSVIQDTFQGVPVHRVQLKAPDYRTDFVSFYHVEVEQRFAGMIKMYKPDVVHFHNLNGVSTGIISQASRSGALAVLTAHDYWGFCYRNTLLRPDGSLCRDRSACADCQMYIHDGRSATIPIRMRKDFLALQFQMLDRLICPSAYLAAAYVESGLVPNWKTVVVHNGADIRRLAGLSRQPANGVVRFAYIGHLGPHKGVAVLLEAFAKLSRSEQVSLSLVGQGDQSEQLKRMALNLGIADRTQFTGKIDNREIERVYRETDVLVIPSVWFENQPVTIMEAMAARTAVIASRIGGIPEFVQHRKSGLLFEPGNADDLAARMQELIDSPAQRQTYVENAWRMIQEETYEQQAARIMQLYDEGPVSGRRELNDGRATVLIVCIGSHLDWQCADAMDGITRAGSHPNWRFVMSDWLDGNYCGAAVAWVTDRTVNPEVVVPAMAGGIPLLVPESHAALRKLCVTSHCGLFYESPDDIEAGLELLVSDQALRTALGDGALKRSLRRR